MLDSFEGIALLVLFLLMALAGLRLTDLAEPVEERDRRVDDDQDRSDDGPASKIERVIDGYDRTVQLETQSVSQAAFEAPARKTLEPLLDEVVERALAHGHKASVRRDEDEKGVRYRLEVRRHDHPAVQPTPYMTFSAGTAKDVAVTWGGDFPGPSDENGHHTEIDWFEADWRDVEKHVLKFARRVFKVYPHQTSAAQ